MALKKALQKRFEAYQKSHGREIFCTKDHTYDITLAWFLVEEDDRDPEEIDVEEAARACGFDKPPVKEEDGYYFFQVPNSTAKVVIDKEHYQKELDLDQPLLFADGEQIDGHHKLYRAFLLGREKMSYQELTEEEIKLCR